MKRPSAKQRSLLHKLIRPAQRKKTRLFIAEGRRAAEQILQARTVKCEFLLVPEDEFELWASGVNKTEVLIGEPELLQKLSDTSHSQQIFAICHEPEPVSESDLADQKGLIVATDALQDPGNVGTIYRTAAWFGASGWIHGKGTVDLFQPKVVRSTAGGTGAVRFCSGALASLLNRFQDNGWQVDVLDSTENARTLKEWEPSSKQIIVVCNEGHGPSAGIKGEFNNVKIPGEANSSVESLNASVAAGIVMHNWFSRVG